MELLWIVIVGTAVWVYFDAKALGARKGLLKGFSDLGGPAAWAIATLLLWIIAFPMYLASRNQIREAARRNSPKRSWR